MRTSTVYLHVPLDSGIPIRLFLENDPDIPREAPTLFKFELSRKKVDFGDLTIDQYWMKPATVYATNSNSINHKSIIGCFWALYKRAQTARETGLDPDATIETYILASLLPKMRTNGSRTVFMDQTPQGTWKKARTSKYAAFDQNEFELNTALVKSKDKQESVIDFHKGVGQVLGPPVYDDTITGPYVEFSNYLFGKDQGTFKNAPEKGFDAVSLRWDSWMNNIGRHSGNENKKTVLNILTYEARAAVHRCYASVWEELRPLLATRFQLTAESEFFHRLWHRDHIVEATEETGRFHLFHGHVFALHPAASFFAKTDAGRTLIGEAIKEVLNGCADQVAFRRFLAGFRVSIFFYYQHIKNVAEERKKRPTSLPNELVTYSHDARSTKSSQRKNLANGSD